MSYPTPDHPLTNPSRVNSPIDGDLSCSAIARQVTSSSATCKSRRKLIAPVIPIVSGLSTGSSKDMD